MSKIEISQANWDVCDELFKAVLNGTEGMGQPFAYSIYADLGVDRPDPNDLQVYYQMTIYEQSHEIVGGGPDDGAECFMGFHVDLSCLLDILDPPEGLTRPQIEFGALLHADKDPAIHVSGRYKGREFTVVISAYPPEDEPPGFTVDHRSGATG